MPTTSTAKNDYSLSYVTRPEFEAFGRSVEAHFSETRDSINNIGRKIDSIANKGTDLKAVFGGVSVLLTVILAIVGLFGWGLNDKMYSMKDQFERNYTNAISRTSNLADNTKWQLDFIHEHATELENAKVETLNARIDALNASLSELRNSVDCSTPPK